MEEAPKVAIVTGGLSGIGLAVAQRLIRDGVRVAVGARRGSERQVQQSVRDAVGSDVYLAHLDVCDPVSVEGFCDQVRAQLGTPNILVNAAGVTHAHKVEGHDLAAWTQVIDTNLTGPFLMTRACLPAMMKSGWGRIVNIASTAAHTAVADHPAYCASKAGLLGLSRAVALEGAPHGVSCVTVSPTWVETEMLRESAGVMAAQSGRTAAEEIADLAKANPQNRLVQPEEIAAVVALACSDAAPALTMEDIQVNAGAHW